MCLKFLNNNLKTTTVFSVQILYLSSTRFFVHFMGGFFRGAFFFLVGFFLGGVLFAFAGVCVIIYLTDTETDAKNV